MKEWLWLSYSNCHGTFYQGGPPTTGLPVHCLLHGEETIKQFWRCGWWVVCPESACAWHPVYVASRSASRAVLHHHHVGSWFYHGTRTMRLDAILHNMQDPLFTLRAD